MKKNLKLTLVILVALVLVISLFQIIIDSPSLIAKKLEKKDLNNKTIVLKLKLLGVIPVGTAKIEELGIERLKGRMVYHIKATASMLPYIEKFFKAKAEADSYVDANKLYSLKFVQHVQTPGDYDYNREILYDQRRKIMKIGDTEREILEDTQDPLSAIFYLRQQKFEVGKEFNININTNQKNYLLAAKVLSYKKIKIGKEENGIWLLGAEIKRRNKSRRHKTSVKIWFLDDETKTPILIRIMASGGLIKARLIAVE